MERDTSEQTVWQGTPSLLAELPRVLLQAVAAVLATIGLRALAHATPRPEVGARDPTRIFTWLTAGVWIAWAIAALAAPLRTRATRYLLTTERLRITTGLLSTATEDIELRRVRDLSVIRPFLLRLLGLGHVVLMSDDRTAPRITLRAVRAPDALQSTIRDLVQRLYQRLGVRQVDVL
jgi:uncharacterized membrane protein YdbT with pleckstrin-like domain